MKTKNRRMKTKNESLAPAAFIAFALLLAALLAASASAQLPPLPTGDKNFPAALAPVVEAEHAFATYSIGRGMKEAFLRFAAPDGVVFRRGPVNAIEGWTQTNPAPTGLLTWWPTYADVSRAGDLGWTTGPYEFRENPSDKEPAGTVHFATLWRKQPDGSFKFVLDFGIHHAAPSTAETTLQYPPTIQKNAGRGKSDVDAEAAHSSLLEAERELAKDSASKSLCRRALPARQHPVQALRPDHLSLLGPRAAPQASRSKDRGLDVETAEG